MSTNLEKIAIFQDFLAREPTAMDRVIRGLERGYTLREIAKVFKVDYSELAVWISQDEDRQRRYTLAATHKANILKDLVVEKLREAVDFDIKDIFRNGAMLPPDQWPEEVRRLVQKIDVSEDGVKAQFPDRLRATEALGKILGMFVERIEKNERVTYVVEVPPMAQSIEEWAKDVTPKPAALPEADGGTG